MSDGEHKLTSQESPVSCSEIQELLFEYMAHELGGGRSDLVREHIRKCPDCQSAAADLQATLEMLESGSHEWRCEPGRLTDERRARIVFSFTHPFLDWVYRRHVLVSIVVTVVALLLLMGVLYRARIWREGRIERGVQVVIGKQSVQPGSTNAPPTD